MTQLTGRATGRWSTCVGLGGLVLGMTGMLAASPLRAETPASASNNTGTSQGATLTNTAPVKERQGGNLGAGILLGDINGLSLKVWDGHAHGLQVRVGSSGLNTFTISANYAYHFRPVDVPEGNYSLPFYIGLGGRFQAEGGPTVNLLGGIEAVAGMSIMVPDLPIELFMEVRPAVVLYTPPVGSEAQVWLGAGIDGGMEIHYYF